MGRLRRTVLAAWLILSFAFLGTAGAAEKVRFMLDWVPYGVFAGFYTALDKGYYSKAGLDVTIQRGFGGASPAVSSKKVEFGIDSPLNILLGRNKGMKVKIVSMFRDKGMMTLFALKSSGIRTAKDLEGRKIGVTVGDALYSTFKVFAQQVGLKKWEFVPVRPAAKNPSLLAKKVDAIATFTSVGVILRFLAAKKGDGIVEFLWSDYGVQLPTDGIVAHEDTIRNRPDYIRKFVAATLKGNVYGIEHPKEAAQHFVKYFPEKKLKLEEAFWRVSIKHQWTADVKPHGLGYIDPVKIKYSRDVGLKAYKDLDKSISELDLYTTKFLPSPLPKANVP
ncbi:MAG: ABC transporter substrate-binding protein [Nitrospinota bacterium]